MAEGEKCPADKPPEQGWSVCYDANNQPASCSLMGAVFSWDFGDETPAATTPNPTHTYSKPEEYEAVLKITDEIKQSCEIEKLVPVRLPLPGWREIPPF
jgi:hypothetical protein